MVGGPGQLSLSGPYDVFPEVIVCKNYSLIRNVLVCFFVAVENVLTQVHIHLAVRRSFLMQKQDCILTKKKYFTG